MTRPTFDANVCPPGCVEHYTGGLGNRWSNHSTAPRYVTAASATKDHEVVNLGVWLEVREDRKQEEPTEVVGVVEQEGPGQAEMSAAQLRTLAMHLLDVANQVDQVGAARMLPVRVSAVSENVGLISVEVCASGIGGRSVHLAATAIAEDLMLSPVDARRLGEALVRAAG